MKNYLSKSNDLRSLKNRNDLKKLFKDIHKNIPVITYKEHLCLFNPILTIKFEYLGYIQCSVCLKVKTKSIEWIKRIYPHIVIYQEWSLYCKENKIKTFKPKRFTVPVLYMKYQLQDAYNKLYWSLVEYNNQQKNK